MGAMLVNSRSPQSGFGLIEVLVALVIFALGVLAMYNIQTSALRVYHGASQLLTATNLGRDITARIRSNFGQLALYNVEQLGADVSPALSHCYTASCSPAQIAQFDLAKLGDELQGSAERVWVDGQERKVGGMTDARACIRSSGSQLTVIISWSIKDKGIASDASQCGGAAAQFADTRSHTQNYVITSHIDVAP
jgi:type IV pilus assembly protein PilV